MNPVTNAHVEIISDLLDRADSVKVMPVVFRSGEREINSRSFPFDFGTREEMLRSVFGDSINVTDDYTFYAPFRRYMPPLLSSMSWRLRRQILRGVEEDFFSYTGDRVEGYMLRLYMLRPRVGTRRPVSASSVRERMYGAALQGGGGAGGNGGGAGGNGGGAGGNGGGRYCRPRPGPRDDCAAPAPPPTAGAGGNTGPWLTDIPGSVAQIIRREWQTVVRFAGSEDITTRIVGMKFPKETGRRAV